MPTIGANTRLLVFAVLMTSAGCSGFGVDGDSDIPRLTPAPVPTEEESPAAIHETEGLTIEANTLNRSGFFRFNISTRNATGQLTMRVRIAATDDVRVDVSLEIGGMSFHDTVSGRRDVVKRQPIASVAGKFVSSAVYEPARMFYVANSSKLASGNTAHPARSRVSIGGTNNYAGIECYEYEFSYPVRRGCFSPVFGLAPYAVYQAEGRELHSKIELVEYKSNISLSCRVCSPAVGMHPL